MTTVTPGTNAASLFEGYSPLEGVYDEMFAAAGQVRPAWSRFAAGLDAIGPTELARRWEQAERMIRENGMTYSAYGDPEETVRPWLLDALPLVIPADEWRGIATGLAQRANLLNRILVDLYGPQDLLQRGLLPAELVFAHPGFERTFHGLRPPHDWWLYVYAADLARAADGRWWVVSDRTDAPIGAGYALENRIVTSRTYPRLIQELPVDRLAAYFIALRDALAKAAPQQKENPRIVLLSQGPKSTHYFEDAYLARYLGYTLVEGGDLTVRNDRVMLKTLGGLLPVDVVLRRIGDGQVDPLELHGDPVLGVPGLVQAARAGHVAVANALGASLVESPAFIPFLPALCRELLGEELQLSSVATWWCGEEGPRRHVLEHLDQLAVRSSFRHNRQSRTPSDQLRERTPAELAELIQARPFDFVGQEQVVRSTVPVRAKTRWRLARVALRAYCVVTPDGWRVMPGGLVRVASTPSPLDFSVLAGEGSKDAWVLADAPVRDVSLLSPAGRLVQLRRSGAELPSRVADNLFWLGRYVDRGDFAARLLRTVLSRITGEVRADASPDAVALLRCLAAQGQIEPGFVIEGIRDQLPTLERALPAAVLDDKLPASLRSTLSAMYRLAFLVRDRLSIDSWRIINRVDRDVQSLAERGDVEPADLLALLGRTVIDLAAFAGLVAESMTRTQAWRFLDLGRRLERSLQIVSLVQNSLLEATQNSAPVLEALLEVGDSQMTYRSRYLATLAPAPVLDLLLTDDTNPRSLAFQLQTLADHVDHLPRDTTQPLRSPEQRIAMTALSSIRQLDIDSLAEIKQPDERCRLERLFDKLTEQLPKLSELISHKYLVHAGVPRQLAELRHDSAGRRRGER